MAIKLQHTPKIIGFLAPKRSKIKPPTGANTAPTMAPGSKTTPASVADCFKQFVQMLVIINHILMLSFVET